jgi:Flp pilus assembly protein TadG
LADRPPVPIVRRGGGERGASLVEFALILPVFMMLVLGMFSGGIAYNRQIALRQAAREGARYGSVLPRTPDIVVVGGVNKTWAQRVQDAVVERSEGELTAADVCVAMVEGTAATPQVITPPTGTTQGSFTTTGTTSGCYSDGGTDGKRRVQVTVAKEAKIEALFFSYSVTLSPKATARHEST